MKYDYFIASRWRNKETVVDFAGKIKAKGKTVYCFVDSDGAEYKLQEWERNYSPEQFMEKFESIPNWKNSPHVKEIFDVGMNALKESSALILLLPAGKSAHLEAGVAFGMGKKCILVGEQKETESLYLIFEEAYPSIEDFIKTLA
ncbi:MAG: hypothetical protein Q8P13_04785 [bacterium]|nr:hypothetical protein [bacterium]